MTDNTCGALLEDMYAVCRIHRLALQETSQQHGNLLAKILQCLKEMQAKQGPDALKGHTHVQQGVAFGNNGGIQTCTVKLDFPRFDGKNPNGWLFKVKQYFAHHRVPDL